MGFFPGVAMVPGGCAPWCGSRGASNVGLVVLRMFLLALVFLGLTFSLQSKLLGEMCEHVSLLCPLVGLLLGPPAHHRPPEGGLGVAACFPAPLTEKQEAAACHVPCAT